MKKQMVWNHGELCVFTTNSEIPKGAKKLSPEKMQKLYQVLLRVKGKWTPIAKEVSEEAGKVIGAKTAFKTLARSFMLEETGFGIAKERGINLNLARSFRAPKGRSKLPKGTYIQINPLATRTEVGLIQQARRAKALKWF